MILSSAPDTVEKTIDFLRMDVAEWDAMTVQATLRPENMMARKLGTTYNAVAFPDLFF